MVVAEFSVVPVVSGSLRPYVKAALAEIERSGLKFEVGAMGTTLEGELDDILAAIRRAHQAVMAAGAGRLVTSIKIDERRDGLTMAGKLKGFRQAGMEVIPGEGTAQADSPDTGKRGEKEKDPGDPGL